MDELLQEAEEIRASAKHTKGKIEEAREQLERRAASLWNDSVDLVRRHPGKALGIAASTGFGLGALLIALSRDREQSASGRLRGLADTGVDAWERVASGFAEAISSLKNAVEEAAGKFK